jgi:hypothetical protein
MVEGAVKKNPRRGVLPHLQKSWARKMEIVQSVDRDLAEFLNDRDPTVRVLAQALAANVLSLRLTMTRLSDPKMRDRGTGKSAMQRVETHTSLIWRLLDRIGALRSGSPEGGSNGETLNEYLRTLENEKPEPGSTQ